ncbi:MAG: hypothetical protein AB7G15_05405 [Alphaproteobacteria bacterium]
MRSVVPPTFFAILQRLLLAVLLAVPLSGCDAIQRRLESYIPTFFPVKEVLHFETDGHACAVAIFALEDSFSTRLALRDAEPLNESARFLRRNEDRDKPDYPLWRRSPIAPYTNIESEPLYNKMLCLYEMKQHKDLFDGVMDTRTDAYFTTQNGFDVVVYVPARNVVIVWSYR